MSSRPRSSAEKILGSYWGVPPGKISICRFTPRILGRHGLPHSQPHEFCDMMSHNSVRPRVRDHGCWRHARHRFGACRFRGGGDDTRRSGRFGGIKGLSDGSFVLTKRQDADGILLTKRPMERGPSASTANPMKLRRFPDSLCQESPPPRTAVLFALAAYWYVRPTGRLP